jgi:hypothetical protein
MQRRARGLPPSTRIVGRRHKPGLNMYGVVDCCVLTAILFCAVLLVRCSQLGEPQPGGWHLAARLHSTTINIKHNFLLFLSCAALYLILQPAGRAPAGWRAFGSCSSSSHSCCTCPREHGRSGKQAAASQNEDNLLHWRCIAAY